MEVGQFFFLDGGWTLFEMEAAQLIEMEAGQLIEMEAG